MQEEWKIYKEYDKPWNAKNPTHYVVEVSNWGNVKTNGILKTFKPGNNCYIYLSGGVLLHRVVAELFIPNPENKPCIDHIDGNKQNNRIDNLQWVTYSENMNNPITIKLQSEVQKIAQLVSKNGMYNKHHKSSSKKLISEQLRNRKTINNGVNEKIVKEEDLNMYLNTGWKIGRIPFTDEHKRNISNGKKRNK